MRHLIQLSLLTGEGEREAQWEDHTFHPHVLQEVGDAVHDMVEELEQQSRHTHRFLYYYTQTGNRRWISVQGHAGRTGETFYERVVNFTSSFKRKSDNRSSYRHSPYKWEHGSRVVIKHHLSIIHHPSWLTGSYLLTGALHGVLRDAIDLVVHLHLAPLAAPHAHQDNSEVCPPKVQSQEVSMLW